MAYVDTTRKIDREWMSYNANHAIGGKDTTSSHSRNGRKAPDNSDRTVQWVDQSKTSPGISTGVNCDTSEELYQAILSAFLDWTASGSDHLRRTNAVTSIATKLNLFGADYQDGQLSQILLQADELRDTVIGLLVRFSSTFCDALISKDRRKTFQEHTGKIKGLTEKAVLLTSLEADEEDFTSPVDGEDDEDPLEFLQDLTDALMDLVPSLEEIYARIHLPQRTYRAKSITTFSVSQSALPFVQNISEEFQKADKHLVERLGEANWQRFMRIRAWRDDAVSHDASASHIFDDGTMPKSLFKPQSLYRDSALGTSIATKAGDNISIASHTSFASSVTENSQARHVPRTPAAVALRRPFVCDICGKTQKGIRNRIDWKIHVFQDLQPYICTINSCDSYLRTFESRSRWADHEFTEHRVMKTWNCPNCSFTASEADTLNKHIRHSHDQIKDSSISTIVSVCLRSHSASAEDQICHLCLEKPGQSRRKFVKHVARHLESIALAALPRETESDSDSGFEDQDNESGNATEFSSLGKHLPVFPFQEPQLSQTAPILYPNNHQWSEQALEPSTQPKSNVLECKEETQSTDASELNDSPDTSYATMAMNEASHSTFHTRSLTQNSSTVYDVDEHDASVVANAFAFEHYGEGLRDPESDYINHSHSSADIKAADAGHFRPATFDINLTDQQPVDHPFKCDQCYTMFAKDRDLKRHKKQHSTYPCSYCDASFVRADVLKRHIIRNHRDIETDEERPLSSQNLRADTIEESDVLTLRIWRGTSYSLSFPARSISDGLIRVEHLRRCTAELTGIADPRRLTFFYNSKKLEDDAAACCDEGLKKGSHVVCYSDLGDTNETGAIEVYPDARYLKDNQGPPSISPDIDNVNDWPSVSNTNHERNDVNMPSSPYARNGDTEKLQPTSANAVKSQANLKLRKRTKTGCLTCRKRRIKCGEERPVCVNCIKSKRSCEGYTPLLTFKDPLNAYQRWPDTGTSASFREDLLPVWKLLDDTSSAFAVNHDTELNVTGEEEKRQAEFVQSEEVYRTDILCIDRVESVRWDSELEEYQYMLADSSNPPEMTWIPEKLLRSIHQGLSTTEHIEASDDLPAHKSLSIDSDSLNVNEPLATFAETECTSQLRRSQEIEAGGSPPTDAPHPSLAPAGRNVGTSSYWSVQEQKEFDALVRLYGRDWEAIGILMSSKTETMVKNHFMRQVSQQNREDLKQWADYADQRNKGSAPLDPLLHPARTTSAYKRQSSPLPYDAYGDPHAPRQDPPTRNIEPEPPDDRKDKKYCICRNVSHGTMIACGNMDCEFEWFHQSCIGITPEPRDTWFCGTCTKKNLDRKYPYHCQGLTTDGQACTKRFPRKSDLDRHYDSVHLKACNHKCALCGSRFARRDTLRRHTEDGCPKRLELLRPGDTAIASEQQPSRWSFQPSPSIEFPRVGSLSAAMPPFSRVSTQPELATTTPIKKNQLSNHKDDASVVQSFK